MVIMLSRKTNPISDETARIYNIMIPDRSDLRRIKEYVNFSFIYDELNTIMTLTSNAPVKTQSGLSKRSY